MKSIWKKVAVLFLVVLSAQTFMFSAEKEADEELDKEMTLVELNKTVITLKYDLYKMENKIEEYEDMSDFDISEKRAITERKLSKYEPELERRNAENKEKAKEAAEQAMKELKPKLKEFAAKSKNFAKFLGSQFSSFLKGLKDKVTE